MLNPNPRRSTPDGGMRATDQFERVRQVSTRLADNFQMRCTSSARLHSYAPPQESCLMLLSINRITPARRVFVSSAVI